MKTIRVKKFNYPYLIPEYKPRSEFQMQKILHKYKVLARRTQIQHTKDDFDIPFQPLSICQYQTPSRRLQVGKILLGYIKLLLP